MSISLGGSARRRAITWRRLHVEPLEERSMLDAAGGAAAADPWHNAALPLDVNNDGVVTTIDALDVINELIASGSGPLPEQGSSGSNLFYDTNGDGMLSPLDALEVINALQASPQLALTTVTPITPDLTPQVTVTSTGQSPIPDGTKIEIDVDLQNNGTYSANYAQATMDAGVATFDLTPALPPSPAGQTYQVNLRAHVVGSDGVLTYSSSQPLLIDTNVSDALSDYVNTPDPTYTYSLVQTTPDPSGHNAFTIYDISMTSQTWRSTADVNQPVWQHWERIFVPTTTNFSTTALFLIDGGSYSSTPPAVDSTAQADGNMAAALNTVFVDLKDVPNEPLEFTGDNPPQERTEDAILAYTFNEFMDNIGQAGNNTWPALLPMVKAAVRGMDTVQSFVNSVDPSATIDNFMVTGYSKRGWTTWLTAAIDPRVVAIIPGVYDNLNVGEQMVHQYEVYGFFSPAVQDYNNLNIFGRMMTPQGEDLAEIIDPYRYLSEPKFASMPKLEINSAGDEFFVSDSAQYYFHDIPGTENYLRYLPNTGHQLDATDPADVMESTMAFYSAVANNDPLPKFSWTVEPDGSIDVQTQTTPSDVELWQATNPTARDFRHGYNPTIIWSSSELTDQGGGLYIGSTPMPATGATAFFVQLTFPSPFPGLPYIFTTEIHVNTTLPLYAWPYPSTLPVQTPPTTTASDDLNGVATAISAASAAATAGKTSAAPSALAPSLIASTASSTTTSASLLMAASDLSSGVAQQDEPTNAGEPDDGFGATWTADLN